MARPRKPYNPNTAYGRRKLREAHAERMANMPESDRKEIENNATGCFCIISYYWWIDYLSIIW